MSAIGVDGCRAGWLAIRLSKGEPPAMRTFPSIRQLWRTWGADCDLLLIDVPIGLPETEASRECDRLARNFLKGRASSVFNPPVRAALHAPNWKEAARRNEESCGKRLSMQSWNIMPKIREVDELLRDMPGLQGRFRESHPESLLTALNNGIAAIHAKKSAEGQQERLQILARHYAGAAAMARQWFSLLPRCEVQPDDIVDAFAAAVVAHRYKENLISMPRVPPLDRFGLKMEIVIPALLSS